MILSKSTVLASRKELKCYFPHSREWPRRFKTCKTTRASKSKVGASNDLLDIKNCPQGYKISNKTEESFQNNSKENCKKKTKLHKVPSLPFLGSLIPQYSGIKLNNVLKDPYAFHLSNYKRYGGFYSYGRPGLGRGINGTQYYITDPDEMLKVLRKEGSHPHGLVSNFWPIIQCFNDQRGQFPSLFGRDEEWVKYRRFLQTDLLTPSSAKGYVPGIVKAAEIASTDAPSYASKMNQYFNFVSFDLFSSLTFGEFTYVASSSDNLSHKANEKNKIFCSSAVTSMSLMFPLLCNEPYMKWLVKLGIKSNLYERFESNFVRAMQIVHEKFEAFYERKENGTLNEYELSSYCSRAIDRMKADPNIEKKDLADMIFVNLTAAVETTATYLSWIIIHLALNPSIQEKMYDELEMNLASTEDGKLSESILTKSRAPYMHAIIRESHRITPVSIASFKDNVGGDVEIHGERFPKDSVLFSLNSYAIGMDSTHVPDCELFRPERWFEDEIIARKGTVAEYLDHPLYREPFSAGARKCPGSRVANYELYVMISQLVNDWKISIMDSEIKSWRDTDYSLRLAIQPTIPQLKFEPRK